MMGGFMLKILPILIYLPVILSYKLNVPRVLLPIFNNISIKFIIEATEGGCYKWSTTRPDIISLTPIDADHDFGCSAKVAVASITKDTSRNVAVVIAEEVNTRRILRCDVIVDIIDSLGMITTTRELFKDEAPEAFEVRAYDSQGNEFSTLEGVEFNWDITCLGSSTGATVLQFITFSESTYEIPHSVAGMEAENKQGHIVLLDGIKTGCVKVSAALPYGEYKNVKPIEVQLAVIANLLIMPADAYVMVGDSVTFQLIHMNNGVMEVINFPDAQFYFEVENDRLAKADKAIGEITAFEEGKTRVVLHDRNVDENDANLKLPAAQLTIVSPAYIVLTVLPHRNWAILLSEHHEIVAEVYSSDDHKLMLGSNVQIHTQIGSPFHVQEISKNGSWISGWGTVAASTTVEARLESVEHPTIGRQVFEKEIVTQSNLLIYPQIVLIPSEIVLPWDPQKRSKYEKQVKASGGDGRFLWSSTNHSVGVVTQTGYVRTHTCGSFEVSAAMMKNHHNRQTAAFYILPPTRLEIVQFTMEAEIGTEITIHVALYADKTSSAQVPFSDCKDLAFRITVSNPSFRFNKTSAVPPAGIACSTIAITGTQVGMTTVGISYSVDGVTLEDSVTVGTYKKLQLIQPRTREVVLAVGTSLDLIFSGGPVPIPGKEFLHSRVASSDDDEIVKVDDTSSPDKTGEIVLNVLCQKLGETKVVLSVTNAPLFPNSKNQKCVAQTKVICSPPKSISLEPDSKVADATACPLGVSATRVVIQSYKDIELNVVVTDGAGRKFMNISSFKFDWSVNPPQLGELLNPDGVIEKDDKTIQIVSPKSHSGTMEVSATISSYHEDKLVSQGIAPQDPDDPSGFLVSTALHLSVVDDAVISPNITSVFNHPGNKKLLSVKQGSGYYELTLSSEELANVKYIEVTRQIEIIPLKDGPLKITVIDLCLPSHPSVIQANIVSVSVIRVEMSDKVEIGRCISCIVKLYDDEDQLLSIPDTNMISLEYELEHEIAKLQRAKADLLQSGEIQYIITGVELGNTKLSFSIGETYSAPIDLQVFSPLKVTPKNTTLCVGAVLQLSSKGGPQPDCSIEYSVENTEIADVSITGLAKASALGTTRIQARAVGINPTTGFKVLYSEDSVDLTVIPITGIKISAPLLRFKVGGTVPAWASGIPDQLTPMIIGTVHPTIKFEWTLDDPGIVNIHGVFKPTGISYLPEDDISIRINGLTPGHTTLNLKAIVPGAAAGSGADQVEFYNSVDIEVFESIALARPKGVTGSFILMAPHCSMHLKTNLDATSKVKYTSPGPDPAFDANTRKALTLPNPIVTLSDDGILQSNGIYGKTMILVTALDEYGLKQSLSVIVEVKPVHYMLLNVVANWQASLPKGLNVIPLGVEFELHVTYHDNTGSQFMIGHSELGIRTSRFDLAKIRPGSCNSTVYVSTRKDGSTMLKVWSDGFQRTSDYVKLHVGGMFSPNADFLTTGDIVCACTAVITNNNVNGKWSSSDHNLLNINTNTGVGVVEGTRSGAVTLTHSLHPGASINLQVEPINQITMMPNSSKPLSTARGAPVYRIPLVLSSEKSLNKTTNVVCNCPSGITNYSQMYFPFTCHVEFTGSSNPVKAVEIFKIRPGFDGCRGQYTCDITPAVTTNPTTSSLKTNASVWAALTNGDVQAAPIDVPFIPGIFVAPTLPLDSNHEANLDIYGLDYVLDGILVEPNDPSLFSIGEPVKYKENLLRYRVHLLDYHWKLDELVDPMTIMVTSKTTDETIPVHVQADGRQGNFGGNTANRCGVDSQPNSTLNDFRYSIMLIATMLTVLMVTYFAYSYIFQNVVNVNVNPDRSLLSGTARSSPRHMGTPASSNCAYVRYKQTTDLNNTRRNVSLPTTSESVYGDPASCFSCPDTSTPRRFR